MSRERSPDRVKAFTQWVKSGRQMKPSEIAEKLGVSAAMVRKWKSIDAWEQQPDKRPRGAPKGNRNARGNKGGAPPGNDNAVKHSLFRKFLPQDPEFLEILDIVEKMDPLDQLWHNINSLFQKIVWSERILYVESKQDISKEIRKTKRTFFGGKDGGSAEENEWEIQFAEDKMASGMKAQAAVMREHRALVKQFLAVAPENDERRLKLELMQAQIAKTKSEVDKAGKMEHTVIFKGGDQLED